MIAIGPFGSNSYLALAAEALRKEGRPLTPAEMLVVARREGFLPEHLYGATMHKTLAARLAEHIRSENDGSFFYRTAPATFFSHELAELERTPAEYKVVYKGFIRAKSIRKENVLVAPRQQISRIIYGSFTPYNEELFNDTYKTICKFVDRARAELDDGVKQFVTFTLVLHERKLLIYRRGQFTTTSDELKGQLSVGFGGHVNDCDFDLFNRGQDAFRANAARELREELYIDDIYRENRDAMEDARVLGYINVDDSLDAEHHIAVLVAFEYKSSELPKKGELSINQLSWFDLDNPSFEIDQFDLWSGIILRNIFDGKIPLAA